MPGLKDYPTPLNDAIISSGMSLPEISANSGLAIWTLSNYRQGKRTPNFGVAARLATTLGVSISQLYPDTLLRGAPLNPDRTPAPNNIRVLLALKGMGFGELHAAMCVNDGFISRSALHCWYDGTNSPQSEKLADEFARRFTKLLETEDHPLTAEMVFPTSYTTRLVEVGNELHPLLLPIQR